MRDGTNLLLAHHSRHLIEALHNGELSDLQSLTKELQRDDIAISEVRMFFDELIVQLPETEACLGQNAIIVKNPSFSPASAKSKLGGGSDLTADELATVQRLIAKQPREAPSATDDDSLSFADRVRKRNKVAQEPQQEFVDTKFLVPTSNCVERLFSMAKRVFSDSRKRALTDMRE